MGHRFLWQEPLLKNIPFRRKSNLFSSNGEIFFHKNTSFWLSTSILISFNFSPFFFYFLPPLIFPFSFFFPPAPFQFSALLGLLPGPPGHVKLCIALHWKLIGLLVKNRNAFQVKRSLGEAIVESGFLYMRYLIEPTHR